MTYPPTATMHVDTGPQGRRGGGATMVNNLQDDNLGAVMSQFSTLSLPGGNMAPAGAAMPNLSATPFMNSADGNIVFATPYPGAVHPLVAAEHAFGAAYPIQYPTGNFGPGAFAPGAMMPFTPGRPVAFADRAPRDVPALENRRGSYSTSATESTPATPFFGNVADRINGTRVASLDRSAYTTPSPRETMAHYLVNNAHSKAASDPELDRLLALNPAIPKAVPAVWTDHIKPLEQCLENRIQGNRNVYIRGLHPTTDDDLLLKYAERFGEVEQSKAIIDTSTGACKGFGFAKFRDVRDSEKCIRGFYRLGYEVGFARESFNARLKAEGDESSTNLYISNLPKDINENMLHQIFDPFHIVSSKILRDSMGNSRGVGFARFETRDICEKVIKNFHGMPIGQDNAMMQVRYADTPAQKELKRITAERRQYRTNEYNIGAYGTHAVGMNPSIYNPPVWNRRPGPSSYSAASSIRAPIHTVHVGHNGNAAQGGGRGQQQTATDPGAGSSDEGSGDEGGTIVDSRNVAAGSSHSSPSVKKEKA